MPTLDAVCMLKIYQLSNLETCIAFSQVCRDHYQLWKSSDTGLVREKVQDRAPWFSLDSSLGLDSWGKCALVAVARTRRALDDKNKNLYVLKNLSVAVTLSCNKMETVKPVNVSNPELRKAMKPLFEHGYVDVNINICDEGPFQGSKLVFLCDVPLGLGVVHGYGDSGFAFSTCYNGYLYVFFEGRFLRLWVDLRRREKFNVEHARGKQLNEEAILGHALTVWDRNFPAIGPFGETGCEIPTWLQTNGRFVTVGSSQGSVVGDILTGTTYFNDTGGLSIPFEDGAKAGFYTADMKKVQRAAELMFDFSDTTEAKDISYCWEDASGDEDGDEDEIDNTFENMFDTPHKFKDESRNTALEEVDNCEMCSVEPVILKDILSIESL
ncbi:hypothetical protein CJU89_4338 [Yarrowia sp. B02]|nr:hypothetical protein CJU89_4338 [Yarrowia sp. B02]